MPPLEIGLPHHSPVTVMRFSKYSISFRIVKLFMQDVDTFFYVTGEKMFPRAFQILQFFKGSGALLTELNY